MNDHNKTKRQLIDELGQLRQRLATLESKAVGGNDPSQVKQDRDRLQAILSAAIESLPFEFFVLGTDGRYLYLNAISRHLFGGGAGKTPEEFAPDEATLHFWLDNNRRAMAGERVEGEFEAQRDGQTRYFYNVVTPVQQGGNFYGILGVNVDVTARKLAEKALQQTRDGLEQRVAERTAELTAVNEQLQREVAERRLAEEALRQSEERFRVAFEEAPVGMVIVVGGAGIARVNRAFCCMSGYTQEELLGKSIGELTHSEDRERSEHLRDRLMAGEIASYELEKRYVGKSGQFFWAHVTTVGIFGPDRQVSFMLAIIEDITARKHAEESLQQEHRLLEYMLHASDHERQLIAYDIHDGLAQQLAGAIMQFQVYDNLKGTTPDEAQKAYFGGVTLLRQAHLEARRLISGVRPPALDEAGVVAAVAHLVDDRGAAGGPKVEFRSKVHFRRLAAVLENVIYRIVQEGLTNALMHSRSNQVRVALLQRDDVLRIEIRDWGVGFDLEKVRQDRFGLAGIRQRAQLLGGKCQIESTPGQGTSIIVELPLIERDEVLAAR